MMQRAKGKRLYFVLGQPWKEALGMLSASQGIDLWHYKGLPKEGDLLVTILDSRPRVIAALEIVAQNTEEGSWLVTDEIELVKPFVSVGAVTARMRRPLPKTFGVLPDDVADAFLAALQAEIKDRTPLAAMEGRRCESTSRLRATGLQAIALGQSNGVCLACDRDFSSVLGGTGLAALEVHHITAIADQENEQLLTEVDELAVVCGACHNLLHTKGKPSVQELRYAWRPACPECDEMVTQPIMWGYPDGPSPDDVVQAGCLVPDIAPTWRCGECQYEWRDADEPRPLDPGFGLRMVIRDHWLVPRTGGLLYNFGADRKLLELRREDDGSYTAQALTYDGKSPDDDFDGHPSNEDMLVCCGTMAQVCESGQNFIEETLCDEDKDPDAWV
jgi:hypothetical protein